MSLKIRRGLESDRTGITPDEGELLYVTNDKTLFIGDGTTAGGNPVVVAYAPAIFPYLILRSTGTDGHRWKFTCGDDGMLIQPGEDLGG